MAVDRKQVEAVAFDAYMFPNAMIQKATRADYEREFLSAPTRDGDGGRDG